LPQLSRASATPYVELLSIGAGRRTFAISLAVLITALLLLMLLAFGPQLPTDEKLQPISVVTISAPQESVDEAQSSRSESVPAAEQPVPTEPDMVEPQPVRMPEPQPAPPPPIPVEPLPSPKAPPIGVRPPVGAVYGPPDRGGSPAARDSERVGTAPNGEPLYAASWYREPTDAELRGFLSTASGPGWGLIACRTAPDYRVEDCVGLDEYPNGSQITRAVLAAAWQFRVRPARIRGRPQVGSWVRIRIDYGIRAR